MKRIVASFSLSILLILSLTACTSKPFPYAGLFENREGEYQLLWINNQEGKLEVPEVFAKLSRWERRDLKAAQEHFRKVDIQSVPMIYIFDNRGVALQTTSIEEAVTYLEKHIKVRDNTIIANGESDHWFGELKYELKEDMLHNEGQLSFLKDPPPKKIEYEFVHTTAFPSGTSGKIEHFNDSLYEFPIGGGGGSINSRDTLSTLTEGVNQMYILVKWEEGGKNIEEKIYLDVSE